MTSEERRGSAQPLHQQQKRRAWLRRASTSSDNQPPPHRSSGRRLSAYDRIIAERVRRGITVNLDRRSSIVSTASSDPESVDSSTGSSSGSGSGSRVRSGSGSGSTSTSGSREHSDVSLRPLALRPDPLDETQMTSQAIHREGAARCQQAGGVPLLDHLIQLAAERGSQQSPQQAAQQGQNGRPVEHPEEKRVRFREGWRSARGTGSLSALHEDEVRSVAERHAPCGILKNGRCHSKSEDKEEESVCVNGETAEKLCKNANRSAVERVAQESKLSETSSMDEAPAVPAPTENGYESDDVFEAKALTTKNASNAESKQLEVEEVSETSASIQDTNNDDEKALSSSAEPHKDTTEQTTTEEKREDSSVPKASASSDLPNELSADVEPSTSDQASTKEEKKDDQPVNLNDLIVEEISAVPETTESSGDTQDQLVSNDPEDTPVPCPLPVPSGIKPRRTRLDSVPEEPPSSPRHPASDPTPSTEKSTSPALLEAGESAPSRPLAPTPPQLRSGRGVPSRRWSISGELTSHRRDRAAIFRRLVYLTLSEEDGEPAPVFEEPTGSAVEFDPRRGEWRPLTGEEGRRLAQHRRLSLTKTCSLDFDRIP
ncbi:actin cytoskeleton-regulatory complex protein pan1-like [Amphibalanus amphitrite]|uniref:actin cytoskeleton-regulatory complex protein pan1-like n=1 Tax=Amphibalanus amphitrite TaxID=1232801 RepID=UPI001C926861|nr:actin cytoskeleton-regulatory complex protein pan1-like [Amphibalanus amphitrite]